MTGYCGADCNGRCAPALPRCTRCGSAMVPNAAELMTVIHGGQVCEWCRPLRLPWHRRVMAWLSGLHARWWS